MNKSHKSDLREPVFTMKKDDRFYKIIVSNPVLFALIPATETVITFIVIRRKSETYSITNIIKTIKDGKSISRSIQEKSPIIAKNIDKEIDKIQTNFTQGVQAQTNFTLQWDILDLSKITDRKEQLQRIKKWGKLKVC